MKVLVKRSPSNSRITKRIATSNFNLTLYPVIIIWVLVGMYLGAIVNVFVLGALAVWGYQKRYSEILIAFIFMLLLSDSRHMALDFAKSTKMFYILVMASIMIFQLPSFRPFNKIYFHFIPFFIFAFISIIYADSAFQSMQRTVSYLLLILIVPNYVQAILKTKREQFFIDLNIFFLGLLFVGLVFRLMAPGVVMFAAGRYTGLLGNPNGLGIFLLLNFIIFTVSKSYYPKLFGTKFTIFAYSLMGISLILCGSRTALFTVFLFILFKETFKISRFLGLLLFFIILISAQLFIANVEAIITALNLQDYLRIETLATGSGRLFAFEVAWESIKENVFIGKGFGYTGELFVKFKDELSLLNHQGNVHNSFLTLWLDTGLWGLIAFVGAWFGYLIKWSQKVFLTIPIIYSIFFSSFFESWLSASLNPFTIQFLLIISIFYYFNENIISTKKKKIDYRRVKLRA
ncbi:MAG: O-antigen ligase family protein [Melioribacteraceae bacterium]|nr:O-antigen ligase family protein [Melioribacteraceae bacterium]MCF8262865.1 O-antigen ligase family protein [Melioribacteraceae bacterium]MCF8430907.1 O-antigen ligase family protein [Melioribacteraceae bacterium]